MLLRFGVKNYRSIRDRQELSFLATAYNEGSAVELPVAPDDVVRVSPIAAVYGSNASGKSNMLRALSAFRDVAMGTPTLLLEEGYEPFALGSTRDEPTAFDVEFVVEGVRYAYGIAYDAVRVRHEWLHAYPHGRRQVWFTRDSSRRQVYQFPSDYIRGAKTLLSDFVRDDASFLSLGILGQHPQLTPLVEALESVGRDVPLAPSRRLDEWLARRWDDRMTELVRRADLGVDGTEIVASEDLDSEEGAVRRRLRLTHAGHPLPLRSESDGTLRWLSLLPNVLYALDHGRLIVIDELDASLHPTLAAEIIRMFRSRELNSKRGQLLFASHDVSVLGSQRGSPLLDRDQVWFTEKSEDGATELYQLSGLRPRKGENIQLGYLAGRYGAAPDLSPGELVRVALIADDAKAA